MVLNPTAEQTAAMASMLCLLSKSSITEPAFHLNGLSLPKTSRLIELSPAPLGPTISPTCQSRSSIGKSPCQRWESFSRGWHVEHAAQLLDARRAIELRLDVHVDFHDLPHVEPKSLIYLCSPLWSTPLANSTIQWTMYMAPSSMSADRGG